MNVNNYKYIIGVLALTSSTVFAKPIDEARKATGVDAVHEGTALPSAYSGKGVVVGIVDAGIDYSHPAFRSADGTLRIRKVWEQGAKASQWGHVPSAGYGMEFTTEEDILTVRGDTKAGSHGTHVTAIAAGSRNAYSGNYHGVAPDADIVIVAIPTDDTDDADNRTIIDAIDYIFHYADSVGKPCVVNLSIGSHRGPHDGTSLLDQHIDSVAGAGRIIVGAAGNYGAEKFHLQCDLTAREGAGTAGSNGMVQTLVKYQNAPSKNSTGGFIDIWGNEGADFKVTLISYNTYTHKVFEELPIYPSDETQKDVNFRSYVTGPLTITSEISPLNGKPHVGIEPHVTGLRTNYQWGLRIERSDDTASSGGNTSSTGAAAQHETTIDIWSDHSHFDLSSMGEEGFSEPTTEATITEIGGTAKRIVSTGAFCTRERYTVQGSGESVASGDRLGEVCSFSGFGPTADGRQKPDVCSPGGIIISALSSNDMSGTQKVARSFNYGSETYSYGYMQGTSMAAPFLTGAAALCLEAFPSMTPEDFLQTLSTTSIHNSDAQHWGAGRINVLALLQEITALKDGITDVSATTSQPIVFDLLGRRVASGHPERIIVKKTKGKK